MRDLRQKWELAGAGRSTPAEILIADIPSPRDPLAAGRHRLELTYDPPELRVGLAISSVGAVLVVLLAVLAARSRNAAAVR